MIDSMLQDSINQTLDDRQARPVAAPVPQSGFNLWRTTTALPRGVAAGARESIAFGADVLGAFGDAGAIAAQADPTTLASSEEMEKRRREAEEARARLDSGEAFSTGVGTALRASARDMVPDPATSNVVEQVLFGLGQFGSKAIGYSVMAGPVAGAVLTGADQAMAAADRLAAEGVDADTRLRAAAVEGVASAAGVALPVAGRTLARTAALVVAGGPGAFVAQQAATRAILENAGYDKIADQYDPFDPVGLAVSTLVPAGFGAVALRGARRAAPAPADPAAARQLVDMGMAERQALRYDDPRLDAYAVTAAQRAGIPPEVLLAAKNAGERSPSSRATSPKGAKGIMQFMDDTWGQYGKGRDVRDPVASIDAAADMFADLGKQYGGDWRAAFAHYNGGTKAGRAVRDGKAPPAAETRAYLERTDRFIAERTGEAAGRAAANDPEAVAAARVQMVRETVESWNLKDPTDIAAAQDHLAAFVRASDQLGAGERVDVTGTINWDTLQNARMLDDMIGRLEAARADLLPDAGMAAEPGAIRSMRDELANLRRSMPDTSAEALRARAKEIQQEGAGRVSFKKAEAAARREIEASMAETNARIEALERQIETNRTAEQARQQVQEIDRQISGVRAARQALDAPPSAPRATALAARQAVQEPAGSAGAAARQRTEPTTTTGGADPQATQGIAADQQQASGGSSTSGAQAAAASVDAQAAEIARLSPDMMVQLEGMEQPMRLADALEAVRREADAEAADAPLLQVAAECFLRSA